MEHPRHQSIEVTPPPPSGSKIAAELELNKRKKNSGSFKEGRERRKLAPNNGSGEKHPRAARLVVAEFKLRRQKGSKISEVWLIRKMKSKIEYCYGKGANDKFKISPNGFQHFKKRHGISLRNRTNKKKDSANDVRLTIKSFHIDIQRALKTTRSGSVVHLHPKYARWIPEQRYNVDQMPLPFVTGHLFKTLIKYVLF